MKGAIVLFQCCIKDDSSEKFFGVAYRIHCTVEVCKPPKAAVFKKYGSEHLGKRSQKEIR